METNHKTIITVEAEIQAPVEKVWKCWTSPDDIVQWNFAIDEWCCPSASVDLKVGGVFNSRMEAKDGSMGFDFHGVYTEVKVNEKLATKLGDDRVVEVLFKSNGNTTTVIESFEAEGVNPVEMQKMGWQSILNNFKKHVESI